MMVDAVPAAVWVSVLTGGVPLVLGVLSWVTMRRATAAAAAKDQGAYIKDIADAGSLARKDLVDQVGWQAQLIDQLQKQVDAGKVRAIEDRRDCDNQIAGLRMSMAQEETWSHRLTAALREAGLAVPERGEP